MTPPNDAKAVLNRLVQAVVDGYGPMPSLGEIIDAMRLLEADKENLQAALRQQTERVEALKELVHEYDAQANKHIAEIDAALAAGKEKP